MSVNKDQREPGFGLFLPLGGLEDELMLEVHTQDNVTARLSVIVSSFFDGFVFRDSLTL